MKIALLSMLFTLPALAAPQVVLHCKNAKGEVATAHFNASILTTPLEQAPKFETIHFTINREKERSWRTSTYMALDTNEWTYVDFTATLKGQVSFTFHKNGPIIGDFSVDGGSSVFEATCVRKQ